MEPQNYHVFTETVVMGDVSQSRQDLLNEYFSAQERNAVADRSNQTLAGLIAAKRAVGRSFGRKKVPWHEIVLSHDQRGKPFVQSAPSSSAGSDYMVSITHTRLAARALVIPLREERR